MARAEFQELYFVTVFFVLLLYNSHERAVFFTYIHFIVFQSTGSRIEEWKTLTMSLEVLFSPIRLFNRFMFMSTDQNY